MPIEVPPVPSLTLRQSCGSIPQVAAILPDVVLESMLPDDLMLASQGINFESANPLPITYEGEINTTRTNEFRIIRVRESTPEGTVERRVAVANIGNQVQAIVSQPEELTAPVQVNPVSESAIETPTDDIKLPKPDLIEEAVPSSKGPTMTDVLLAEFNSKPSTGSSGSTWGSGYTWPTTSYTPPPSYSTPSYTYTPPPPTYNPAPAPAPTPTGGGVSSLTLEQAQQQAAIEAAKAIQKLFESGFFSVFPVIDFSGSFG